MDRHRPRCVLELVHHFLPFCFFVSCMCVSVSGVLFSVGVCVCVCDLLIFLTVSLIISPPVCGRCSFGG